MQQYYRFQSRIYDSTRWSFLFGRKSILRHLQQKITYPPEHIVEIGCGTGFNLAAMARLWPAAKITGYDVSEDMLSIARQKTKALPQVHLRQKPYGPEHPAPGCDLILFSYSLSMINPHWLILLDQAIKDLQPRGHLALVDFHRTRWGWFRRHMGNHHVRMEGHLLEAIRKSTLDIKFKSVRRAYGGVWEYVQLIARKD